MIRCHCDRIKGAYLTLADSRKTETKYIPFTMAIQILSNLHPGAPGAAYDIFGAVPGALHLALLCNFGIGTLPSSMRRSPRGNKRTSKS